MSRYGKPSLALVAAVVAWSVWGGSAAAQVPASSADDVCPPTADPCVITQTIEVQTGATLDFGTRAVLVSSGGLLDFGERAATILSGDFTVDVGATAGIDAKKVVAGSAQGGTVTIAARRACSANPLVPCLRDFDCQSLSLGSCSVGTGNLTLNGRLAGSAEVPASVSLTAAGNLTISQVINIDGTTVDSDGGVIDLEAVAGSVVLDQSIKATSGTFGQGGELTVIAGTDIVVNSLLDLRGGDSDGGVLDFTASGDIQVHEDLLLDASSGEGFGGDLTMIAEGDLTIVGGTANNRLQVSTDGHASSDGFGGDGGSQDLAASGSITLGPFARLESNGAIPDGFGGDISLDAGGGAVVQGQIQAKARGGQGAGGLVEILSGGDLDMQSTSDVDVTGGDAGGGELDCSADGDASFAGSADLSASGGGSAGALLLAVGGDLDVSGSVLLSGPGNFGGGGVVLSGCLVQISSGAFIDNRSDPGENRLIARARILVDAGSTVSASGTGGQNVFVFRDPAFPPLVSGTVSPAPLLVPDTTLVACPACGNGVLDAGETCDDGNSAGGDGCSFDCQDEGCVADTPGFPAVALCDDGQDCSNDACNTVDHRCEHVFPCDDGIACTAESCIGTTCVSTPSDPLCDDGNGCTLDVCVDGVGCQFSTAGDGTPCDDGLFCNGTDTCSGGLCALHSGDPCPGVSTGCSGLCNETGRSCLSPPGTPCDSDGNACTDDACDGAGVCEHRFNLAACDDGVFCNGPDICVAGSCLFHSGNPCAFGPQCANTCNETLATCFSPAGASCVADANVCTDDACDGAGSCVASANTAACDDGDLCTVTDQCSQGVCAAGDVSLLVRARFKSVTKPGADNDKLVLKAESPASLLASVPTDTGMTFRFLNASGTQFYSATVPASAFEAAGFSATKFRFRDRHGLVASANGMVKAGVKIRAGKDVVKIKTKTSGVEVPGAVGQSSGAVSVIFGTDPAVDACFTGREMFCTGNLSRRTCKTR